MIKRVEIHKAKADAKKNRKPNYWLMLIFALVFGGLVYIGGKLVNKYL